MYLLQLRCTYLVYFGVHTSADDMTPQTIIDCGNANLLSSENNTLDLLATVQLIGVFGPCKMLLVLKECDSCSSCPGYICLWWLLKHSSSSSLFVKLPQLLNRFFCQLFRLHMLLCLPICSFHLTFKNNFFSWLFFSWLFVFSFPCVNAFWTSRSFAHDCVVYRLKDHFKHL